jgi:hypothetical protein
MQVDLMENMTGHECLLNFARGMPEGGTKPAEGRLHKL